MKAKEARKYMGQMMKGVRRSKYGNSKVVMDGVEHASKKQGLRWVRLRQDERDGKIRNLRREVPYRLEVNGKLICKYIADHVYEEVTGVFWASKGVEWSPVVEDVKSPITRKNRAYRIKVKLMRAIHGITIKEV